MHERYLGGKYVHKSCGEFFSLLKKVLWMMRCSPETLRLSRALMASFVKAGTFIVSA